MPEITQKEITQELEKLKTRVIKRLHAVYEDWQSPMILSALFNPFNVRLRKLGYTATELAEVMDEEGHFFKLSGPTPRNRTYICPVIEGKTREDWLDALVEVDKIFNKNKRIEKEKGI